MSLALLLLTLSALAGAPSSAPSSARSSSSPNPAHGTWVLAKSPDDVQVELTRAIDTVLAEMPMLFRAIARGRLERATTVCRAYHFVVQDDAFALKCDEEAVYTRPAAGPHQTTGKDGHPLQSDLTLRADGFDLRWTSESGVRANRFRVADDVLTLDVEVSSDKLPVPLTWTLDYRRP